MTNDNSSDNVIGSVGIDTIDYSALTTNLSVSLNRNVQVNVAGSGTGANTDQISSIENFIGGAGNDSITGDTLANRLVGGAGADSIDGGNGADVLTGGLGADVFSYGNINQSGIGAAVRDSITDFLSGSDKLNFAAIDADTRGAAPGNQAFTFNNTAGAAFTAAGQLVYHYEGSGPNEITVIQGNVNANLAADFEVALLGHIVFNAATDIVL
jgi:Ca2+-binding RTX toxin-like protein